MKYRELAVLLPCHSLEDFPLYHVGRDADSLLACWTALWHPALLASADSAPKWHRIDLPPDDLADKLILVPTVSESQLPSGFGQLSKDAGAVLLRGECDRDVILAKAFERLDGDAAAMDLDLVADFLATGYAYLQVQILTRQMRYASNLDETQFFSQLLAAAKEAQAGEIEGARGKLTACFNLLAEERDHYYSVDAYLIDLTLLADQTLGAELRCELSGQTPINLLINGEIATQMQQRQPDTLRELLAALQDERVGLLGGEYDERRLPLLPCEDVLAGLRDGHRVMNDVLGRRVEVFARRRFGLTPFLPGMLEKLRFRGSLHATLDDGQFPFGTQVKTRWQGVDAGVIDAIAKPPLDAGKPETFLGYAQKLGESMDTDHVATLCLAHWPGQTSPWYQDLKRCARYTSALGKFITVERYFADTYLPGHLDRFEADQYRSPYLRQDVIRKQPDPISSTVRIWRRRAAVDAIEAIGILASVVENAVPADASQENASKESLQPSNDERSDNEQLVAELSLRQNRLAKSLPRSDSPAQPAYLVVNPCSHMRRIGVDVSMLTALPDVESPVLLADEMAGRKLAVVDVPPMGFVWVTGGTGSRGSAKKKAEPRLAEDARQRTGLIFLRNEHMEAAISPVTGTLQSLNDYKTRGNRLSQQLALRTPGERGQVGDRWRDPDELATYSVMAADEVNVTSDSAVLGEVETRGRLLREDGQALAAFRQTYRLWRGSRVLQVDVELDTISEPSSDPWNSYYACRFAWPDEAVELFRDVNQTRQPASKKRLEATLYVELESGEKRITLLTGGLPYHRRVGSRMLDSLLVVRGERARKFQLGIGVDLSHPLPEALALMVPAASTHETAPPPKPANCWLFQIDGRSVVATHWSPLVNEGKLVGVRVRLLESSGRTVRARLTAFRAFTSARQVNFLGEILSELAIAEGKVILDLTAHEWIEVEARWG